MQNRMLLAFLGAAFACLYTAGAVADDEPIGGWVWGIYGGALIPDPNEFDTGPTGGLRIGYRTGEHTGISGSLGYATVEGETGSGPLKIKGDVDAWLLDFNVWYIFRPQSRLSLTIGAGPGWAWNDGSLTNNAGNSVDKGHITDDSITANVAFGPILKLGKSANLRLLTRFRYIDERGSGNDVDREITLGLMFPLGEKKAAPAPVVAAAPPPPPKPPPPPPPAKCPDGDNDGVCDAADQCPDTPAGKRVGASGCDCDFTMHLQFALNSAELTASDKTQLDQVGDLLKNPKLGFINAEINGYTDSTGSDAYNMGLSQRRADSVASYLKSKGASQNFTVKGYGESDPIASNDTADGRAQNRRVVIRRTDCDK